MWTSKLGNKYPMAQIQQNDQASQKELKRLRGLRCNSTCADCGRLDNTWASISHGVFICVVCSDVHRSVGTHISKVKGCTGTYLWGPDELEKMQAMGNHMGEEVYGSQKVDPNASKEQKQKYVTEKYEKRLLVDRDRSLAVKPASAAAEPKATTAKAKGEALTVRRAEQSFDAAVSRPNAQARVGLGPIACKANIPDSLFDDFFNKSEDSYFAQPLKSSDAHVVQPAPQKCASVDSGLDDFLNSTLCANAQSKVANIAGYPAALDPFCSVKTAPVTDPFADWSF